MDADAWPWIWLFAAAGLAIGEIAAPGTFFLVSFAIGAAAACVLAFLDLNIALQWFVFVVGSGAALAALVPIGRRMAKGDQQPVGSTRLPGMRGVVLQTIPAGDHETGLVRVEREHWRAESIDQRELEVGTPVTVVRVDGTRLVVRSEM